MHILFICTGNTCRSPMAEGILKDMAKKRDLDIRVSSAGIFAQEDGPIAENSIQALKEIHIDISHYRSKSLDEDMVREADLILTMGHSHKSFIEEKYPASQGKLFTLLEYVYGFNDDIGDPFGGDIDIYRYTRDEIYQAIREMKIEG